MYFLFYNLCVRFYSFFVFLGANSGSNLFTRPNFQRPQLGAHTHIHACLHMRAWIKKSNRELWVNKFKHRNCVSGFYFISFFYCFTSIFLLLRRSSLSTNAKGKQKQKQKRNAHMMKNMYVFEQHVNVLHAEMQRKAMNRCRWRGWRRRGTAKFMVKYSAAANSEQ